MKCYGAHVRVLFHYSYSYGLRLYQRGAAINVLFMTDRASAAVAKQTFRSALININVHVVGSVSDHPTQGPARGTTRGD